MIVSGHKTSEQNTMTAALLENWREMDKFSDDEKNFLSKKSLLQLLLDLTNYCGNFHRIKTSIESVLTAMSVTN